MGSDKFPVNFLWQFTKYPILLVVLQIDATWNNAKSFRIFINIPNENLLDDFILIYKLPPFDFAQYKKQ